MFAFKSIAFLLLTVLCLVNGQSNSNDGGRSNSRNRCVALGRACGDDDDCCARRGACTARSYPARCRRFFRRGGQCDSNSQDGNDNACCRLKTVCKRCKGGGAKCVSDDDCCGDLDCNYRSRSASFGKCRRSRRNSRD